MLFFQIEQCFVWFLSVLECSRMRRQSWASGKMFGITCCSNRVLPDKVCFHLSTCFDIWKHINYKFCQSEGCHMFFIDLTFRYTMKKLHISIRAQKNYSFNSIKCSNNKYFIIFQCFTSCKRWQLYHAMLRGMDGWDQQSVLLSFLKVLFRWYIWV